MVFVIAKTGMTLTFNYQGHFRTKMVENITFFIEKGSFSPIN